MSTIAGIFNKKGKAVLSDSLQLMLDHAVTRFYEQSDSWNDGNIGLAQLHRFNTPESSYIQLPYVSKDAHLIIVADARIDNRSELAEKLKIRTEDLPELADAHLILKAYQQWGTACPHYLLGDFAFAIYDQSLQQLFLAKDPLGIKRLMYYENQDFFAFASSSKSLLALPFVPFQVDELTTYRYLTSPIGGYGGRTFFKGVFSLHAGHYVTVGVHGTQKKQYWNWEKELKPLPFKTEAEFIAAAQAIFEKAVQARTRTHKKIAAELSGGLDSSGIVCLIAHQLKLGETLPVFCNVELHPTDPNILRERKHMDAVLAQHDNLVPQFIDEHAYSSIFRSILQSIDIIGYPNNTGLALFGVPLHEKALSMGVSVILSGFGGDHCVSYRGNNDVYDLLKENNWREICSAIKYPQHRSSKYRIQSIIYHFFRTKFSIDLKQWSKKDSTAVQLRKKRLAAILNPTFSEASKTALEQEKLLSTTSPAMESVFKLCQKDTFDNFQNLADYHGTEYRYPMLDVRLLRLFAQLPTSMRIRKGIQRYLFRKTIEPLTPKIVTWRKDKAGHTAPAVIKLVQQEQDFLRKKMHTKIKENNLEHLFNEKALLEEKGDLRILSIYTLFDSQDKMK